MTTLSTLEVSPKADYKNVLVREDLTYQVSGGEQVKPYLLLNKTKDRFGGKKSYGFTFSMNGAGEGILLNDLYEISENDISADEQGTETGFLAWCLQTVMLSETADMMADEAATNGWSIELSDLSGQDYHLNVVEKHIVLNTHGLGAQSLRKSEYFRNIVVVSLVRALRDVWQEARHGGFEDDYGPESILMLERIRAADCDIITVLVAWEISLTEETDIWRHMIGSEEGDIAMAFSAAMDSANSSSIHGAMHTAFRQWFASEDRINVCDHETLEYLDTFIAEEGVEGFGHSYLTPARLEILSCLPDKTAYLQYAGQELISDPLYAGMANAINQSHFMHIMHDMESTTVAGVSFRSADLAAKIFPAQTKEYVDA